MNECTFAVVLELLLLWIHGGRNARTLNLAPIWMFQPGCSGHHVSCVQLLALHHYCKHGSRSCFRTKKDTSTLQSTSIVHVSEVITEVEAPRHQFSAVHDALMVACSSRSCPTNKGNKATTISSSSCAYEPRLQEGQRSSQMIKHCSGQW